MTAWDDIREKIHNLPYDKMESPKTKKAPKPPQRVLDRALYKVGPMLFEVWMIRERWTYGQWDVLVAPVAGSGEKWVRASSLQQVDEEGDQ